MLNRRLGTLQNVIGMLIALVHGLLLYRATAESLLKGKPNGTFLCRPSKSQQQSSTAVTCVHSHTIDIM